MRKIFNNLIGAVGLTCSLTNINEVVNIVLCVLSAFVLIFNFVLSIRDKLKDGSVSDEEYQQIQEEAEKLKEELEELRGDTNND